LFVAKREPGVTIALTDSQVAEVVREAAGGVGLKRLMAGVSDLDELRRLVMPLLDDVKCSRSTFRALMVLVAFPADGSELDLTEVARRLDLSPSTTHRYISTWMAVGLLEQDPRTRRYRRASGVSLSPSGEGGAAGSRRRRSTAGSRS
jgi:DNA-binding MarR family transcriptional regulator